MKVVVTIDRNEKKPLRFPSTLRWFPTRASRGQTLLIRQERRVLPAGDYALKGHEERCIIERKGSLKELAQNVLSDDWRRAYAAFQRLSDATANPYLMLECTAAELRNQGPWVQQPERVVDALMALTEKLRFRLLLVGSVKDIKQKRTVGELMLRLMLAHTFQEEVDLSCDTAIQRLLSPLEPNETSPKEKGDPA